MRGGAGGVEFRVYGLGFRVESSPHSDPREGSKVRVR